MRPSKNINPDAHRSGSASGGKNRHFTTPAETPAVEPDHEPAPQLYVPESVRSTPPEQMTTKYDGRQSVGPDPFDGPDVTVDLTHEDWVDPLDTEDHRDLSAVTIDLRDQMREDVPDTYYQRFGSRVPGHRA